MGMILLNYIGSDLIFIERRQWKFFWFKHVYWVAINQRNRITMTGKTPDEAMDKLRSWSGGGYYG